VAVHGPSLAGGQVPHSITSSARSSMLGGTVRPSALSVLRLMISENFVLLNREVSRTGASEDPVDVGRRLRVHVDWVEHVGDQTASAGKVRRAD